MEELVLKHFCINILLLIGYAFIFYITAFILKRLNVPLNIGVPIFITVSLLAVCAFPLLGIRVIPSEDVIVIEGDYYRQDNDGKQVPIENIISKDQHGNIYIIKH